MADRTSSNIGITVLPSARNAAASAPEPARPTATNAAGTGPTRDLTIAIQPAPAAPVIGIRTTDIAKAERDVVAAGGVLTRSPYDYPGGRRFFFREPGGAELMVYSPKG